MSDDWAAQEEAFFGKPVSKKQNKASKIAKKGVERIKERANSLGRTAKKEIERFAYTTVPKSSTASQPNGKKSSRPYWKNELRPSTQQPRTTCTPTTTPNTSISSYPGIRRNNDRPPMQPDSPILPYDGWLTRTTETLNRNLQRVIPNGCVVCGMFSPLEYRYHPFWSSERACATHTDIIKCTACQRFEPGPHNTGGAEFADLEDNGRKLCPACLRTVIVDSSDAQPLWFSVIHFFDVQHSLFTSVYSEYDLQQLKTRMESIPILIVNYDGLNDPCVQGSGHGQGLTRGLCMFEYRYVPGFSGGGNLRNFLENGSTGVFQSVLSDITKAISVTSANVTAILCLKGLPRDLVSSILAHEATHAWFKLHPSYDPAHPIPLQVEEGCCQLMAFLYLSYLSDCDTSQKNEEDGQPSDAKLRQFFKYCIETETSEIYGEGFRQAAGAYAKCHNLAALLEHVALHKSFPS